MRKFRLILTILAFSVLFAGASYSYTMTEKVVVANQLIAVIRAAADDFSPSERTERINERFAEIVATEELTEDNIYLSTINNCKVIMVGSKVFLTVTEADAKLNNTTVDDLAVQWLANCRAILPQARPKPEME